MKKIMFLDIDGTILDCLGGINKIDLEVKRSIREFQSEGNYAFIATGRPYAFLNEELMEFGFDGFILSNGAQVIIDNKTVHSKNMDKRFLKELLSMLEENNIQYLLNGERDSYLKEEYEAFHNFFANIGVSKKYLKSEYSLDEINVFKVEIMCLNIEDVEKCKSFVEKNLEYDYFSSIGSMNLEVYHRENTKATGILKSLEKLEINIENTYAFGDGKNDIEMLAVVECGIAMGNASEEVKGYAKYVTDSVHDNGVATGIKKYVLNKK